MTILQIVKPELDTSSKQGDAIKSGAIIRLQHMRTQKWLHSHLHASPISGNLEVSWLSFFFLFLTMLLTRSSYHGLLIYSASWLICNPFLYGHKNTLFLLLTFFILIGHVGCTF